LVVKHKIPCFEVYSSQIEIIEEPFDFYLSMIKLIKSAKERIVISSLYLGTGKMEEFLVDQLYKALNSNPNLKLTILLDKSRSSREENSMKTSITMLNRLVSEVTYIFN
jgi:CDP-diacylglycerol--glycerol-3-phosphate 3-phosphatidyltransferase